MRTCWQYEDNLNGCISSRLPDTTRLELPRRLPDYQN